MANVKIYSTPTCPYCKKAKQLLDSNGIDYVSVDVSGDEEAMKEMVDKTGQMSVPVLLINGELVVGFDKKKIAELLDIS